MDVVFTLAALHTGFAAQTRGVLNQANPAFPVAEVNEESVSRTVYVDNANPAASDLGLGTPEIPFKTLSASVQFADNHVRAGVGMKIVVRPGTYREELELQPAELSVTAPLVIEAERPGTAVLSGADLWGEWQKLDATTYTHHWPYKWGYAAYPPHWRGNVILKPIVRRREMVFLNGVPLNQVLARWQLYPGSFYVAEDEQTIAVRLAEGVNLLEAAVEVSLRPSLLRISGRSNVVIRGITFRYANSTLPDAAVRITDASRVLIDNCEFSLNNADGLNVLTSRDIILRKNRAVNNGNSGMGGYEIRDLVLESNDTSSNNWRGVRGDYTGWGVAGAKFGRVHNAIIEAHTASANQARGLWLDFDIVNVTIQNGQFNHNLRDGVFVEASQGPVSVLHNYLCGSKTAAGFSGSSSTDVLVSDNVLCGNAAAQIQVTGDGERSVTNWETRTTLKIRTQQWTVSDNTIMRSKASEVWFESVNWVWFLESLASDWNVWSGSVKGPGFCVGKQDWSFSRWQKVTRQDANSLTSAIELRLPIELPIQSKIGTN